MYLNTEQPILTRMHGKVTQKVGRWHGGRILATHLLVIFTAGDATMQIGEEVYHAVGGDALLIPGNTFYAPLDGGGCEYWFFHFSAPDAPPPQAELTVEQNEHLPLGEFAYTYHFENSPILSIATHSKNVGGRVQEILERIKKLNLRQNHEEKPLLDCYLREILIKISREMTEQAVLDPTLRQILDYIGKEYPRELSLSSLSSYFHLSQSYIARLFREKLHTRSADYINQVRISSACDLLLNTALSVTEISERVGFHNPYYFSRVFRSQYGMTPSQFRKTNFRHIP